MKKTVSGNNSAQQSFNFFAPSIIMQDPPKSRFQIFKKNGLTINSLMGFLNGELPEESPALAIAIEPHFKRTHETTDVLNETATPSSCGPVANFKNKDKIEKMPLIEKNNMSFDDKMILDTFKRNVEDIAEVNLLNLDLLVSDVVKCDTAKESKNTSSDTKQIGGGEDNCTAVLPYAAFNVKLNSKFQKDEDNYENSSHISEIVENKNIYPDIHEEIKLSTKIESFKTYDVYKKESSSSILNPDQGLVSSITNRLNESYQIQERLASENKTLESSKYQLEERVLSKEGECEKLQNQVDSLTNELRKLKEHAGFVSKLRNNETEEDSTKIQSEAGWFEAEIKRLHLELNVLKKQRDWLSNRKAIATSERCINTTNNSQVDSRPELNTPLKEIKQLQNEYENIKEQLDKTLEENKNLIKREIELEQAKTEVANSEKVIKETNTKLQELVAEKKISLEEIEDLRCILEDRLLEMQEYRKKYLQAQQRVEELNCELNEKQAEIVSVRRESDEEIRIVKALYQEKVAGIDAITATMKEMQVKLYQHQQQKLLLEAGIEEAKRELEHVMDKNVAMLKIIEDEKLIRVTNLNERQKLEGQIVQIEEKYSEARKENSDLQARSARLDEGISHLEVRLAEKTKEAVETAKCLEEAKQDSYRQINRIKERSESSRRNLQIQLAENERELAGARASVKAANKERDEIRHKLQSQINSLTENLEEGQKRWKGLQAHVSSLQSSLCPKASNSK